MSRRRAWSAGAAVVLVVAAFLVALAKPGDYAGQEPFVVPVETGERGTGRDIEARFDAARLAEEVEIGRWLGTTSGVWLVVDAQFASVHDEKIADAELAIGERTWTASSRPRGTLHTTALSPRMPVVGVIVFEIPAEALEEDAAKDARVRVAGSVDQRLDSLIEWTVDLTSLSVERLVVADSAEDGAW